MDRAVVKVDPADVTPLRSVTKVDPKDVTPLNSAKSAGTVADPLAVPGGAREPLGSKIKRFGRAASQYDPSNPANVGRVAPLAVGVGLPIAAGIATDGASIPIQAAVQGLAGAASPYAEAATSKLLGGNPAMPSWRDAAKSGLINAAFTAGGALIADAKGGASEVTPEMERTTPTIKNLNQAARNRDTWKALGLSDEQADMAVKAPDAEQFLAQSVEQADLTKNTYSRVINSTKRDFENRYTDAYTVTTPHGESKNLLDAPTDLAPVSQTMQKVLEQNQGKLSPGLESWIKEQSDAISGGKLDPLVGKMSSEDIASLTPAERAQAEKFFSKLKSPDSVAKKASYREGEAPASAAPEQPPSATVQHIRDLRTKLARKIPAQANDFDQRAAAQIKQSLDNLHDQTLLANDASYENLGRIAGVDKDWGVMKETERLFDPAQKEKLADGVNAALWGKMGANPDNAANLIRYAKAANELNPDLMPKLRESFLNMAAQEARTGNTPINEMRALQTLQAKWGDKGGTQVVLNEMFGKDSPLSSPTTLAKVLGAPPIDPQKLGYVQSMTQRAASYPYLLRMGVLYGLAGGGMMAITRDPEKAAIAIAGLAGMQLGGKLLARMGRAGQEAYVNFRLNPTESNFKDFMKVSGAMIGATAEMPSSNEAR